MGHLLLPVARASAWQALSALRVVVRPVIWIFGCSSTSVIVVIIATSSDLSRHCPLAARIALTPIKSGLF